jgi:hypothetical protein
MSEKPVWMNLSLGAAMDRLEFWQGALKKAEREQNIEEANKAAQFIEEYGKLIADMTAKKPPVAQ